MRLSHHIRHVRFWFCDASQRCSLGGASRWVGLLRTHLLPAIIDIDSLCIYPPSHQVAYHRTLHEWTRFDTCRSLHRQSLRTITYDIVELDELRDCPTSMIPPYLDGPFQFHDGCRIFIKREKKNISSIRLETVRLVVSSSATVASVHLFSEDFSRADGDLCSAWYVFPCPTYSTVYGLSVVETRGR
jgi:hypothetical protein